MKRYELIVNLKGVGTILSTIHINTGFQVTIFQQVSKSAFFVKKPQPPIASHNELNIKNQENSKLSSGNS